MNKIKFITGILCLSIGTSYSQVDTTFIKHNITFGEYSRLVRSHNLEYAAEKFNVTISEAAVEAAKIFPDPYLALDYSESREDGLRSGYEYSSEFGTTIELGGKRRARIDLAKSENDLTKALLEDYFRNLQAEATLYYLEALKQKKIFEVSCNSYTTMKKLAEADSIRFLFGSIMQIDATQSRMEAGILYNELILAVTEWKNSLSQISLMTGFFNSDTLYNPVSHLHDACRLFSLDKLITEAQNNRADLIAALHNKEVSQRLYQLTKKERITDIDLKIGASRAYSTDGISPASKGITGGIEVPLKFSNMYKGELKMAQAKIEQTEEIYLLAGMQIRTEITQAWNSYYVYCKQVENFNNGLLDMASGVIKGKIYSYQRGESSLLEVLNAQRTFNDIQTAYYEAIFNRAAALVNLERSAGIWDINF